MQSGIPPPVIVNFLITRKCNLRCKHCYTNSTDSPHLEELNTSEAKRVIIEIADAGARFLVFDGGEPLARPDIYELITHAKEAGLRCVLITNATLLSTETAGKLKSAGLEALDISLYSNNAKSHDDFSGVEGSWLRTRTGINNALVARLPFQINTCVSRHNLTQIDDIVNLARDSGAVAFESFNFIPLGRGKEHPDLVLTPQQRQALVTQIVQHQHNDRKMSYRCTAIPQFSVEVKEVLLEENQSQWFARTCCSAGLSSCCVFYEGTVYPCLVLPKSAGNIRRRSFQQIWRNAKVFKTLRNRAKLGGKCKQCIYRQLCGGARCSVFAETRSLTKEDKDCWLRQEESGKSLTPRGIVCAHCGEEPVVICQHCRSPLCSKDSILCPLCHVPLCRPDVKTCSSKHRCPSATT